MQERSRPNDSAPSLDHRRRRTERQVLAMNIRWLGHAAFSLEADGSTVLIDPWLTGNPKAAASADELDAKAILLTHGHPDHYGDVVDIAKRTGATVVAITEMEGEASPGVRGGHHALATQ